MALVKICGITNAEDALAAVEAGADLLGFNFYSKSPRYISPREARRIAEALPRSVARVGVFVNEDGPEAIARAVSEADVGAAQLHGDETPEFCARLVEISVIKALRVGRGFSVERASLYKTDALLLDAYVKDAWGGTGQTFDWSVARRTREVVAKLFLAGGLTPENVAEAVREVRPFAVDVCSGVETSPGRKSYELMRNFVEAVRAVEG
ncbi:MAG TPA: phosphoribosylanthranilate isomerase [Pyrinomonadaceae bacterium]|jgi:phosphoribosylanthranilate isomerase|nr:phosphoribosylanthranilate isomerase [Pyrinomonadaceae bacterium]